MYRSWSVQILAFLLLETELPPNCSRIFGLNMGINRIFAVICAKSERFLYCGNNSSSGAASAASVRTPLPTPSWLFQRPLLSTSRHFRLQELQILSRSLIVTSTEQLRSRGTGLQKTSFFVAPQGFQKSHVYGLSPP